MTFTGAEMRTFASALLVIFLGGCAFHSTFHRSPGAPSLPASSAVAVVAEPPAGSTPLGTVSVRGNSWQSGSGCESQAVFEAKKVGATHVVVRPKQSPWYRSGQPECEAAAYYLAR